MKLEIPDRPFRGYIFDCDGTIADTMPLHYRAWRHVMDGEGAEFPEDLFYAWGGRPAREIVAALNERCGLAMRVEEVAARKESCFREILHEARPIEPVLDIARRMHGLAPLAVASGGHREIIEATLDHLGVRGLFDAVVCFEDYARGKPAPDPFLEAARRIGVPPPDCLVFEDSPTGIEAARAAGMASVLVPPLPRNQ
ncbi:MAG: HAD-IA family hydrolase [Terrimicrobiaceae bacterium]|nr:HAD-IA family hydrolase [Terrimicrobiaceae bacterium]